MKGGGLLRIPTKAQALALLEEGGRKNPGPWVRHCRYAGKAAQAIAAKTKTLDPEAACILGLLHDIGRRFGVTGSRHIYDGWAFAKEHCWDDLARVCLTHSFPLQDIEACSGSWDVGGVDGSEKREKAAALLKDVSYDDYDRLLQLCDALALPDGFSLLEQRWVDVVLRYGTNPLLPQKWAATYALKRHFEALCGVKDLYCLLPGIVERTFPWAFA